MALRPKAKPQGRPMKAGASVEAGFSGESGPRDGMQSLRERVCL